MKRILGLIALGLAVVVLAGCSSSDGVSEEAGGEVAARRVYGEEAGVDIVFDIQTDLADESVGVDFRGEVLTGTVRVQLLDAEGEIVWQEAVERKGVFVVNEVITLPQPATYQLVTAWDEALTASYALEWRFGEILEPVVEPIALLSSVGTLIAAAAALGYTIVRKLRYKYFVAGAAIWIGALLLQFTLAVPLNLYIDGLLGGSASAEVVWSAYQGMLSALFQIVLTWLVVRYAIKGEATMQDAVALGFGIGAIEALAWGLTTVLTTVATIRSPETAPLYVGPYSVLNDPIYGGGLLVQQVAGMLIYLFGSVLVIYAVARRRPGPALLAFGYKALITTAVPLLYAWPLLADAGVWVVPLVMALWAVLGVLGTKRVAELNWEEQGA